MRAAWVAASLRIASASAIDAPTCACFAARSRASMRTRGWPAATASPSLTSTSSTVPMSFVLNVACRSGAAVPEASKVASMTVSFTV